MYWHRKSAGNTLASVQQKDGGRIANRRIFQH
jgi:hypothetical protein